MSTSSKYVLASHFDAITAEFRVIQIYESCAVVEKDTDRYGRLVGNSLSRCQCSFQNSYLMYLGGNNHNHNRTVIKKSSNLCGFLLLRLEIW